MTDGVSVHVRREEHFGVSEGFPERGLEDHGIFVAFLDLAIVEPPSHRVVNEELDASGGIQVIEAGHELAGVGDEV